MGEKQFRDNIEKLRSPKRLQRLEVERVVALCQEGVNGNSILDVGTGSGVFAEAFATRFDTVVGIDTNPEMIAVAREYVPAAKFHEGKAESIPSANATYDVVFLGHVLHESDSPLDVLLEAKRCAKMRVVVLEWPYKDEEMGPPIDNRIKPDEVSQLADKVGFQTAETIELSHMTLYRFTL